MRLSSILPLALTIAASACMLPRPIPAPDYVGACPSSTAAPPDGSLLFATFRLADCRYFPKIVMTWHRAHDANFGALTDGKTSFHDKAAWRLSARRQLVAAAKAGKPGVIFIHGYNTGQTKALDRAEAIRTAIEGDRPVIAVTWPSYASGTKYFWDEANSDWTSAHARTFLNELVDDTPVIIVAHSMGSRIALDAARSLRRDDGSTPVRQLIMAAPDVDRDALVKEIGAKRRVAGSITIYGSREDQALSGSWRLHGYARAGDLSRWVTGRDPDYERFRDIDGVTIVDTTEVSEDFWAHAAFIETYEGAADLCRVIRGWPTLNWREAAYALPTNIWTLLPRPTTSDRCSWPGYNAARRLAG